MNNLPFSGPVPELPEAVSEMVVLRPRAADPIYMSSKHSKDEWHEFNMGLHQRRVAHRAVEDARRSKVLMYAALLLCIPAFSAGMVFAVLCVFANRQSDASLAVALVAGCCVGALGAGSAFAWRVSQRLVELTVERFGKGAWE
jgi:hypothetical protein